MKRMSLFALAAVLAGSISGCAWLPPETLVRIYNETPGWLYGTLEAEGLDPQVIDIGPAQGTEEQFGEYYVIFPDGVTRLSIELTITGDFSATQVLSANLVRHIKEEFTIVSDCGNMNFGNHDETSDVLWAWLVPEDPLTYSTRDQVVAEAALAVQNISHPEGYGGGPCPPGTYYVIFQTDTDFYYLEDPVIITLEQYSGTELMMTLVHPTL